jgi:hypothetical protein
MYIHEGRGWSFFDRVSWLPPLLVNSHQIVFDEGS